MNRFTSVASSVVVLLVTSSLFLTGCGQSNSGEKMGVADAKMTEGMMTNDKMDGGKMSEGKMSDAKMSDGKMGDDKMAGK